MLTRLTLDQVVIPEGRRLDPGDDVLLLAEAIRSGDLDRPILVAEIDQEFRLIDGLRRLEATRRVGFATIEAVVTDVLEEACAHLEKENEGVVLTPARRWQLVRDTHPLVELRVSRIRRRKVPSGGELAAVLQGRAIGVKASEAERIWEVYRKAAKAGDEGVEIVRQIEAGHLTSSQAFTRLMAKRPVLQGVARRPPDQEVVLANAARTLTMTIRAAGQVADPGAMPTDRLVEIVAEMKKARGNLHRLIKKLSEEISE